MLNKFFLLKRSIHILYTIFVL